MKLLTKKKRKGYSKKVYEETWNVDYELIKWVNEHFKAYLDIASDIVDLTEHKFEFKGKTYTQKAMIKKVINITDYLLSDYFLPTSIKTIDNKKDELYEIMCIIHWSMWW